MFIFSCQVFSQENNSIAFLDSTSTKVVEQESDPDDFIAVEKEAVVDYLELQKAVVYPDLAVKAGIQGTVVVQVLIGTDGLAKKTRILSSDNKLLNESALKAVREFRGFKPAIQKQKPVATWMSIPIKYKLNSDDKSFWEKLWDFFF